MNYRLRIKLTRRDLLQALVLFQWSALKRNPATYIVLALLMGASVYLAYTDYRSAVVFAMFVTMMVGIIFFLIPSFQTDHQIKKNPQLFRETAIRFTREYFAIKPGSSEIRLRWDEVAGWQAGKRVLLIYQTASNFHIVPLSGFTGQGQYDKVLALLIEKVGPRGKLQRKAC
jgi:YcxB-like protein